MIPLPSAPLAQARSLCSQGKKTEAEQLLLQFARTRLELDCTRVALNPDGYSLNSLNGLLTLATPFQGESSLFFKYHQEEDESKGVGEYYHSKLLEGAGLPVDVPLAARHEPGEQILLYRVRTDARLADVCRELEHGRFSRFSQEEIIRLQQELDRQVGAKYLETLHLEAPGEAARASLHQLFYHRLVDADGTKPGGRLRSFYLEQDFAFRGLVAPLPWRNLAGLKWRINGRLYEHTLDQLFGEALHLLDPAHLPDPCPVVLGHGDAHNANVWIEEGETRARLVFFDPAFAGAHLPALLAEIKPTFHNLFAHRDWLYHPEEAASALHAKARVRGGVLEVEHDWQLTSLRQGFLRSKEELVWRPLLAATRRLLPQLAWERYVRLALFCCPTLVMNLRAGAARHNSTTSLLGLALAVMCGSAPVEGEDEVSGFIARLRG